LEALTVTAEALRSVGLDGESSWDWGCVEVVAAGSVVAGSLMVERWFVVWRLEEDLMIRNVCLMR
jgi:hypothetical protein